ncbi:crotonase/enoyl-CoA hydratase family protein [Kordiimonas sp.]|uniref:crotonase/enoyl-CoA hydratase family protein n=1 Tax=Kordiimonas sp. TaxID=1970157 RepID=UPI003A956E49
MAVYETITLTREGSAAILTLNRPDNMNAFTPTMARELEAVCDVVDADDSIRALVVTGAGRAFCAGMDLSASGNVFGLDESIDPLSPEMERNRDTGGRVVLRLFRLKKPVIGAINGASVGVGTTMQLPMDVRIASPYAKFGFVFAERGITLESCASWFLPRLVGVAQALDWSLSGRVFKAEEALKGGLISEIVEPDNLMARALELAESYTARTSAISVAINRQLIWRMMGASHPMEAHMIESRTMLHTSMHDGREGVQSFLEKRAPEFSDKVSSGPVPGFDWDAEPPFE